ncbi:MULTISPECIES: redoxin domain-containing protein [Paenibacillus]|jgi:peroxiredoxin|uniref:Redoxin domain-containing protein n=2 Tax=Paenibacillus TaxID=44249 RepID=A0AAJ2JWA8_9BACL|nr:MULTISPECIES: redoxin domain-containing protein [Paenibacillus]MCY9530478.1 redoxin domain-containing protein [Paenibacillus alvei]MDT8976055.1 redoxin domain-containing protein [Paenibacillus sp. chi10]GAV11098.1 thiol-disulfide oxidoreductase ResA [Paenibacillus sp. NAIST15-1]
MILGKRNKTVQILILAVIAILGGIAISNAYSKPTYPEVGSRIPDVSLHTLKGDTVQLSDYKGKSLVLNFWGSWCEPCEREMPTLQKAADDWKDRNVEVVGINYGEDAIVVDNYMKAVNVHFTMLLDSNKSVTKAFGVRPLPTTFFIKPDGKVHAIHTGEVTTSQLESYLEQMAKE